MLLNMLKQFNWVDIFIFILAARVFYSALRSGFPIELFKLIGTIAAVYISMHYYLTISSFLTKYVPEQNMLAKFLDLVIFVILAIAGYLIFGILRSLFNRFLMVEAVSALNRWGGLMLGIFRISILTSLLMFIFVFSGIGYLNKSVKSSYLGTRAFNVAPATYSWIWNSIISKFATTENYNKTISSVTENFSK